MVKGAGFQNKLQRMVRTRLLGLILVVSLFLIGSMFLSVFVIQFKNTERNSLVYEEKMNALYRTAEAFLNEKDLLEQSQKVLDFSAEAKSMGYLLYSFNSNSPIRAELVLTDKGRKVRYNSFPEDRWDTYRESFNASFCDHAFLAGQDSLYAGVYYYINDSSAYVLTKQVISDGKVTGFLNLYLDGEKMSEYFKEAPFEGVITDRQGHVIFASKTAFITEINRFEKERFSANGEEKESYSISEVYLEDAQVYVYSLVNKYPNIGLWIGGLFIVSAVVLFWFVLAMSMVKVMADEKSASIRELLTDIETMRTAGPDNRMEIQTEDEFALVREYINRLVDHTQELSDLTYQAEMERLTEQLNPHFLYNTLEIIRGLLIFDRNLADETIIRLTGILRYAISEEKAEVYLDTDMEYIDMYMSIQKTRFGDNITFDTMIDEACRRRKVPRLLLQPIIENSIKYGFRKKKKVEISVRGKMENECLVLGVRDNGGGMDEEKLNELIKAVNEKEVTRHKGLHNIARRLYLQYGDQSGLTLRNTREGFEVEIRINGEPKYV